MFLNIYKLILLYRLYYHKMGYIQEFGFRIFKIRESKGESEYLLYNILNKTYNFYSEKRIIKFLILELREKNIDLIDFAVKKLHLDPTEVKPMKLLITWIDDEIRLIDNIGYKPIEEIIFKEDNKTFFNTYKKSNYLKLYTLEKEDFSIITSLMMNLVNNEEEEYNYMVKWIAWQIQNPLDRLPTSIILQGEHGTGKTKFCELVLKPIFESNFCEIGQADINKEYNDYIMGKQLIVANEVIHNDNKFLVPDKLKNYVTDSFLSINRKFKDTIYVRNYSQWIFVTNNYIPLKIEKGDRRYNVFKSKKLKNGRELISNLIKNHDNQIKSFINHLLTLKVEYNEVDNPIENQAKIDLIKSSNNSIQDFIDWIIEDLGGFDKLHLQYDLNCELINQNDKIGVIHQQFYTMYCAYCNDWVLNPVSKTYFTKTLKHQGFRVKNEWLNGKSVRFLILK